MKIKTIQISLVFILVGSLALQLLAIVIVRTRMWPEDFQSLMLKLLGVYSAQIGLVLGGIVGDNRIKKKSAPLGEALTALGLAFGWVLLIGWRPIALVFASQDSVKQVLSYLDEVSAAASFLLAAALTYFFTKKFD